MAGYNEKKRRSMFARKVRRATHNAVIHGLTMVRHNNPDYSEDITKLAKVLCDGNSSPALFQSALGLATAQVALREVQKHKHFLINRLRYPSRFRSTKGYGSALYSIRYIERQHNQMSRFLDEAFPPPYAECPSGRAANADELVNAVLAPPKLRGEMQIVSMALPELVRLARYEADAYRMWNRAFRRFMQIRVLQPRQVGPAAGP